MSASALIPHVHWACARTGNRSVDYYRGQFLDWNERVGAAGRDDWKQYHYRRRERCEQEYSGCGKKEATVVKTYAATAVLDVEKEMAAGRMRQRATVRLSI